MAHDCRSLCEWSFRYSWPAEVEWLLQKRKAGRARRNSGVRLLQVAYIASAWRLEYAARVAALLRRPDLVREGFQLPTESGAACLLSCRSGELSLLCVAQWR